jgi:membrane-bound serine protease (ClpP class)
MKRLLCILLTLSFFAVNGYSQTVYSITVDATINPATAEYIENGIRKAEDARANCLLILLNTPGGLLKSTRVIVSNIIDANVPVIVFVAPPGAHAGSAGVFITMAAHIAAMAPGTNIGAAHPVELQGSPDSVMNEKSTNDAVAFIKSIAGKRNRNLQWAEDAVRNSRAITEKEALENNVIDLVAANVPDLLNKLDGRKVELPYFTATLQTKNARIVKVEMTALEKMLNLLSDPNIAYILLMIGFYGVLFELYNPGAILPGIVGVISLILAFYSMHTLPVNYAGLALIVFAIILFILEVKMATHGVLAIGGAVSLLLGSFMLIQSNSSLEYVKISQSVIYSTVIITTLFFLFIIGAGLKAQRATPVTGMEGMKGEIGEVTELLEPIGYVRVHGELWKAESVSGKIEKGKKVKVVRMEGLKLFVEPVSFNV